jgi:hypothetical protein
MLHTVDPDTNPLLRDRLHHPYSRFSVTDLYLNNTVAIKFSLIDF